MDFDATTRALHVISGGRPLSDSGARRHASRAGTPSVGDPEGARFLLEYFDEGGNGQYPMTVGAVGRTALYDPKNTRVRG